MMSFVKRVLIVVLCFTSISCISSGDNNMFIGNVKKLIAADNEDQEELALGELLTVARKTNINYGYRVFNKTKNKRVLPEEIDDYLNDELEVTIFVGKKTPYEEFKWYPKYNGHITRLIVP